MTLSAEVFPKWRTPKNMLRWISKRSRFKRSFGKQHGKRAKILLKFEWQHIYQIYWSLWRQLTCKNSHLVIYKISKLFPNTLSADGKYSLLNWDNLTQPIQMQLSQKQNTFSEFFSKFLKSSLCFEHFHTKKMTLIAEVFPKLRTPKDMVRSISKKFLFKGSFGKQHDKLTETLLKFDHHHIYQIYWSLWRQWF